MSVKHTKEYAEKIARENVVYGESLGNYVFGYLKALEETGAPEMLTALEYVLREVEKLGLEDVFDLNIIKKAIKKSK